MATKAAKTSNTTTTAAIATALTSLANAQTALARIGLASLTPAERQESSGKLRQGEAAAMTDVLDTVDAFTSLFASLADKDGGVDDAKVETAPSRAQLALFSALAPVLAKIDELRSAVSDTMLVAAETAKDVTVPAYAIIRANAPANPKLARSAARAIAFYGQSAKQRAANAAKATRAAKKAAKPGA